jgi:hypothetical protein
VFALSPSASSCERNWSSFGFIQNKLRNRLSDEKTQKLVFIFVNMKMLDKQKNRVGYIEDEVDFPDEMAIEENGELPQATYGDA